MKLKNDGYWYYQHLDHGTPAGQQAQTLNSYASAAPGGKATLPLYILYHPTSAVTPASGARPAVEGINVVFANKIARIVKGKCSRTEKKVDYWRNDFLPLSDLLCWPAVLTDPSQPSRPNAPQFVVGSAGPFRPALTGGFHPDLVARRLQARRERVSAAGITGRDAPTPQRIEPADGIPQEIKRAIDREVSAEDRKRLKRTRVILTTSITRGDPSYSFVEQAAGLPQS